MPSLARRAGADSLAIEPTTAGRLWSARSTRRELEFSHPVSRIPYPVSRIPYPASRHFPESKPGAGRIHSLDAMETSLPSPPPVNASAIANVRTWCAFCHASALLGVLVHFPGHLLGPLIVWLVKRDDSPEIDAHGKEALNFQISMLIYNVVAAIFCLVLIGFVFLAILWVLNAIFVIIAAIQASDGKFYRYPMTIRFIQ